MGANVEREPTCPLRRKILRAALAALCAVLAAYPALAQEGAPAAGGDAPQAAAGAPAKGPAPAGGAAIRDVEPFTPQREAAGLQRRANMKALIANARAHAAGALASLPAANMRTAPPPVFSGGGGATPRSAIGVPLPAAPLPGHPVAGIPAAAGGRPAGTGTPPPGVAGATHYVPLPNAGPPPRGAVINGAMMGRTSSGPGYVGGPAKDRSGINGTLMSPKR
jgi:hypothetical protein